MGGRVPHVRPCNLLLSGPTQPDPTRPGETYHLTGAGAAAGEDLVAQPDVAVLAGELAADKVVDRQLDGLLRCDTLDSRSALWNANATFALTIN